MRVEEWSEKEQKRERGKGKKTIACIFISYPLFIKCSFSSICKAHRMSEEEQKEKSGEKERQKEREEGKEEGKTNLSLDRRLSFLPSFLLQLLPRFQCTIVAGPTQRYREQTRSRISRLRSKWPHGSAQAASSLTVRARKARKTREKIEKEKRTVLPSKENNRPQTKQFFSNIKFVILCI